MRKSVSTLIFLALICMVTLPAGIRGEDEFEQEVDAEGKSLSLFNVIKFPNDICSGDSTKNGTCYTSEECSDLGGTASGTCASGYGVCCIFTLSCGGSSSENCTYVEQSSFTAASSLDANPCGYSICKLSSDICRIRLDFTKHILSDPVTGTVVVGGTNVIDSRYAHGQCVTDTFTYASPGKNGAPVICGYNTGQHMILEASDVCNTLSFSIGSSTTTSREWTIKVTQYNCGDEIAGPEGCLQYLTGSSGDFASFNFATNSATVGATSTHLADQQYSVCVRRESGYCRICYSPYVDDPAPNADTLPQSSYGVSISPVAASQSGADTDCSTDYVSIPEAVANTVTVSDTAGTNRQCGRFFSSARAATDTATVCSLQVPFTVGVYFDENEFLSMTTSTMGQLSELSEAPSGTNGFWLSYFQTTC